MEINSSYSLIPLLRVAWEGNTVEAQTLIEEGADLDAKDSSGRTALMIAADRGHTYIVQLLVEHGADASAKDNKGMTALQAAKSRGYTRIVSLLKQSSAHEGALETEGAEDQSRKANHLALHRAVDEGDIPTLNALIKKGADVDARSYDEWTPLMLATIKGHTDIVGALLKSGADVNARNKRGWTALMFAVSLSDVETMRILLGGEANANARDTDGKTALMQAVGERNIESVKVLIENGADVNLEDFSGETALATALRRGYTEISDLLRQAGAKLKASQAASQRPAPAGTPDTTINGEALFNEGELQRLKQELDGLLPNEWPPSVSPEVQALDQNTTESVALVPAQISKIGERIVLALEALRRAEATGGPHISLADIGHKIMLTVMEASALSNLSRTHVRKAIKAGELKAKIIGRGWRIKRTDLNSYVKQL